MTYATYVFDAYGTLLDVHSAVRRHAEAVGPEAALLSQIWRQKQLEYSWVRALMDRYQDFWWLTEAALDFAFEMVPSADRATRPALLEAYRTLDCYSDVPQALSELRQRGARTIVLSNGTPDMLAAALRSSAIAELLDSVVSVDALKTYKTSQRVYERVTDDLRVFPEAVSFQSSNRWDIAGATAFGFRTVWINRTQQPDEYADLPPAAILPSLDGLNALG